MALGLELDEADSEGDAFIAEGPGDRVGRYKLEKRLGEGGCGVVYLAEQEEPIRRRVALKIIKLGMDTEGTIARFETERQTLALMDHPNIAKVLDAGATAQGRPFFVMELVAGVPITRYCRERRLPVEVVLRLFLRVCQAVQHAHQKGIIHRDLKPSNILVTDSNGEIIPIVIDFGVAKATQAPLTEQAVVTHPGQVMGTLAYMSPEQASLGTLDIDTRADVYSLGVVLYELLTGQTPFDTTRLLKVGQHAILKAIREDEPAKPSTKLGTLGSQELCTLAQQRRVEPAKLNRLVRGELDWIVMKCLEKDRTRRYGTANGLAADVQRYLNNEPVMARPTSRAYRLQKLVSRNKLAVSAGGIVAGALILGSAVSTSLYLKERTARQHAAVAERNAEAQSAISSDALSRLRIQFGEIASERGKPGAQLSYLAAILRNHPTNQLAMDRLLAALAHRDYCLPVCPPITHLGDVNTAEFSRDGTLVATGSADCRAAVFDSRSGRLFAGPMDHKKEVVQVHLSPDNTLLLTCSNDKVAHLWDARPGPPGENRLRAELGGHSNAVVCAEFNRDGTRALTASLDGTVRVWEISDPPRLLSILSHPTNVLWATFSAYEEKILTASVDGMARIWFGIENPRSGPKLVHPGPVTQCVFSPDGRVVATVSAEAVRLWDATTGSPLSAPLIHASTVNQVVFSPDGERLASATGNVLSRKSGAYIWGVSNSAWGLIAGPLLPECQITALDFSPDGLNLITGGWDRTARFWDGHTGAPLAEPLLHKGTVFHVCFSPDGQTVVTTSSFERLATIWKAPWVRSENLWFKSHAGVLGLDIRSDGRTAMSTAGNGISFSDLQTGTSSSLIWTDSPPMYAARFTTDGNRAVSVFERKLRLWNADTGKTLSESDRLVGAVQSIELSKRGNHIACVVANTNVVIWDLGKELSSPRWLPHPTGIASARFSDDGHYLLTAGGDGIARIWNAQTADLVNDHIFSENRSFTLPRDLVWNFFLASKQNPVATSGASQSGATGSASVEMPSWAIASPETRVWAGAAFSNFVFANPQIIEYANRQLLLRRGPLLWADFSPNGRFIVTASFDGTAQLWDLVKNKGMRSPLPHLGAVRYAEFSRDSGKVLTCSDDHTARIWDVATGVAVSQPLEHAGTVFDGHFSQDGCKVVTVGLDCRARVWDTVTGLPLTDWLPFSGRPRGAVFTPDGQKVVGFATDDYVRVWDIFSPREPVPSRFLSLVEALAGSKNLADSAESRDVSQLFNVAQQRGRDHRQDFFSRFARWMVADGAADPIWPCGQVSREDYLARLIANDDLISLNQAVRLSPTNGVALAHLAAKVGCQSLEANPRRTAEARMLMRRALQMAPNNTEIRKLSQQRYTTD
jgi:WD40 repeat protein/serine/threonine protein kinase